MLCCRRGCRHSWQLEATTAADLTFLVGPHLVLLFKGKSKPSPPPQWSPFLPLHPTCHLFSPPSTPPTTAPPLCSAFPVNRLVGSSWAGNFLPWDDLFMTSVQLAPGLGEPATRPVHCLAAQHTAQYNNVLKMAPSSLLTLTQQRVEMLF